jgi:hypothetical protein
LRSISTTIIKPFAMIKTHSAGFCLFCLAAFWPWLAAAEENAIYKELLNQGVQLSNGKTITLSEPVMADGLKADAQKAVLTQVGPKIKTQIQPFLRGNPNDWYEDKQADENGSKADDSIGRRIDLYFVAKGKLQTIASEGFVQQQMKEEKAEEESGSSDSTKKTDDSKGTGEGTDAAKKEDATKTAPAKTTANKPQNGKVEFYTDDELKSRKLTAINKDNLRERYAHGLLNLLDDVQVEGSGYGIETRSPESLIIAFKLDHRFDKDPKYPNQYQLIKNNAAGAPILGNPKPYDGFAGYAKITKLQGPEDKIFVEYHVIYDEPYEWFNGTTALITKLDQGVYQKAIRKFRRNVLEYEKTHPATAK